MRLYNGQKYPCLILFFFFPWTLSYIYIYIYIFFFFLGCGCDSCFVFCLIRHDFFFNKLGDCFFFFFFFFVLIGHHFLIVNLYKLVFPSLHFSTPTKQKREKLKYFLSSYFSILPPFFIPSLFPPHQQHSLSLMVFPFKISWLICYIHQVDYTPLSRF